MSSPRADFFDLCGVRNTTFWPLHRQELSREASGRAQGKDLGDPLWRASYTTSPAHIRDAQALEAALISLRGVVGSFLAHDVRRPFPAAHPDGDFADTGQIGTLYADNAFHIQLTGLPSGLTLSPGDYLGFQYGARPYYALHMVTGLISGSFVANSSGDTGRLEVFPDLPPDATTATPVTLKRAPCEMRLEPGQTPPVLEELVASSVTFTGIQV